uniref:Uncharacterized protein n=1 Tax=viral metagenome TaxID=1070528 RepID=A0A6C0EZJ7_9ZZZZ
MSIQALRFRQPQLRITQYILQRTTILRNPMLDFTFHGQQTPMRFLFLLQVTRRKCVSKLYKIILIMQLPEM